MIDRYIERLEKLWKTRKRKSAEEIHWLASELVKAEQEYGAIVEVEDGIDIYELAGFGKEI